MLNRITLHVVDAINVSLPCRQFDRNTLNTKITITLRFNSISEVATKLHFYWKYLWCFDQNSRNQGLRQFIFRSPWKYEVMNNIDEILRWHCDNDMIIQMTMWDNFMQGWNLVSYFTSATILVPQRRHQLSAISLNYAIVRQGT